METAAALNLPPQVTLALPDDPPERAIAETLKLMRDEVAGTDDCPGARERPAIRQLALSIVSDLPSKKWLQECAGVFAWVRGNIRFVRDPRGIEMIHTAEGVLDDGQGDCDDHSILVAALLESIGHPCRFKAVSFRSGEFVHVYAQALIGRTWVALDTTEDHPMGWQPPRIYDRMIMHIPSGRRPRAGTYNG